MARLERRIVMAKSVLASDGKAEREVLLRVNEKEGLLPYGSLPGDIAYSMRTWTEQQGSSSTTLDWR